MSSKGFKHNVLDLLMFSVYKSRCSGGLTTLPERVGEILVHGPCVDSMTGAVSGVVNIFGPAFEFCDVCGARCDGGIGDDRVELGAVVISEGRSSVECSIAGCLVVASRAKRLRPSVPLWVPTR